MALSEVLNSSGDDVVPLVRRAATAEEIRWSVVDQYIDRERLEGCDAVVHLAGASIADGRWTPKRKAVIRDSRVDGTRLLCEALAQLSHKPQVLVTGSAVGFYGDAKDREVDEASPVGEGFLADVCQAWERAAQPARDAGIRVVYLRTGLVMDPSGGALSKMVPVFRMGAGGPLGDGRQYMPWITLRDQVRVIQHCIRSDLEGPVNATAPQPVEQRVFARALGRALRRPAFAPAPRFVIRALLGQMGTEALLTGQRAVPRALLDSGFAFLDPELEPALTSMLA